jgi:hypothetical protein
MRVYVYGRQGHNEGFELLYMDYEGYCLMRRDAVYSGREEQLGVMVRRDILCFASARFESRRA